MKNTIKTFVLVLVMAVLCVAMATTAFAEGAIVQEGVCGGVSYDEGMSDNGAAKYTLYEDGTLEIYGEGGIRSNFFDMEFSGYIKNVIIKNGITEIHYGAFQYSSVVSVTIAESVNLIASRAFDNCYNLQSVTILNPDCEIYESSRTIYSYSGATICGFEGSTAQSYADQYDREFKIYCPHESTTDVAETPVSCYEKGYTAGTKCNNCKEFLSGGNVIDPSHKDENTDGNCDVCEKAMPTETGSCGGNVYEYSSEYFNDGAVRYYKYADGTLEIFGKGSIKHYAFDYDNTITKVIIMDGITEILVEAFYECKKIESVSFPETLTYIDCSAFANCINLRSVVFPNSIERFYSNAFDNCARLEEIVLPEAIYDIPGANFQGCIRLAKITIMNPDCKIASRADIFPESATIYGYEGSTAEEYADDWNRKFVVIGSEEEGDDEGGNIGGEEVPEIPHEHKFPTEWSVVTEANCSQNGIAIRVCTQCSVFEYTVTPAYGHFDTDSDSFCDDCKVVIALPEEDTPEDVHTHSFPASWIILTEATCSQSGIAVRACEGCLLYEYNTVPAFGHNDADGDKLCDTCKVALGLPQISDTTDIPSQDISTNAFSFLTDLINQLMDLIKKAFKIA